MLFERISESDANTTSGKEGKLCINEGMSDAGLNALLMP